MLGVRGCMCGGVVGDGYVEGWTGVVGERGSEVGVRVGVYFGGGGGGGGEGGGGLEPKQIARQGGRGGVTGN